MRRTPEPEEIKMKFYDRLQASIACDEALYKAPTSKQLVGVPYRSLDVLPENLRGLWCLIHTMRNEVDEICDSIRRRELGCKPDEDVRDDHDHTEMVVYDELRSDPNHRKVVGWLNMATQLFTHALKEVFPDEEEMEMYIRSNSLHVDDSWSISVPNPTKET